MAISSTMTTICSGTILSGQIGITRFASGGGGYTFWNNQPFQPMPALLNSEIVDANGVVWVCGASTGYTWVRKGEIVVPIYNSPIK